MTARTAYTEYGIDGKVREVGAGLGVGQPMKERLKSSLNSGWNVRLRRLQRRFIRYLGDGLNPHWVAYIVLRKTEEVEAPPHHIAGIYRHLKSTAD